MAFRSKLKGFIPPGLLTLYRLLPSVRDTSSVIAFLSGKRNFRIPFRDRWALVKKIYRISCYLPGTHTQEEMILFIQAMLSIPREVPGCVVEAGSYKGASTAKFSIAAKMANRELVVFDSFEGIPENSEPHDRNIYGGKAKFLKGDYCGSLDEVKANIQKFGSIEVCRFIKGWFEDTMPHFREPVAAAFLDVDLASSTQTCLKYLFPLLVPGGVLFSQDGHLPLVIKVFEDEEFWNKEVGCPRPNIERLGKRLVKIAKPLESRA